MTFLAHPPQGLGPEKHEKTLNYLNPPPDVRPLVLGDSFLLVQGLGPLRGEGR